MNDRGSMHVLVTGGSGFIGRRVVARLLELGHRVTATMTRWSETPIAADRLRWATWDAEREPLPDVDYASLDAIIHLAKPADPFDFPDSAELIYEMTVGTAFRLLEKARSKGVRRVILASSGDVFGPPLDPSWHDKTRGTTPASLYAAGKAASELIARGYAGAVSTAVLRFYYPYGPGAERYVVGRLMDAVAENRPITIQGDDGIRLNPVWIDDLADGVCAALSSEAAGVFELGGREIVYLREIIELIGETMDRQPVIQRGPASDIPARIADIEPAHTHFGFAPTVTLREGIGQLVRARQTALEPAAV